MTQKLSSASTVQQRKTPVASPAPAPVTPGANSLTFGSRNGPVATNVSSTNQGLAGLAFLQQLAADLAHGPVDLPCFPNVVIKVRDALNNPKTSPDETVKLVGTEPRLAARLIQTANSAAFNMSGKRVTDLRTAVTRLGHQVVQGAAMSFVIQQMKDEPNLRSIAKPLSALWKQSVTVACIAQVVARRTKVPADEGFLAGLLHGIGRLYIMAHAVGKPGATQQDLQRLELILGWHPTIAKSVLENWEVGEVFAEAVGDQDDYERESKRPADLTDVLIVSILLAKALARPAPRVIKMQEASAFAHIGMTKEDCAATLLHAEYHLGSLQEALGC